MTTIQDIADKMGVSKSTVSKALNDAPDISEALRKQVLETAVALGYTKLRRYKKPTKKVCIIIEKENMRYQEPHHFAYDILVGFRQMAEPAGFDVEIVPVDIKTQRSQHYDVFMLKHDYIGAFVVGFSLSDPWIQDFKISRTPAVLFDNYIVGNPSTAYVGIDNENGACRLLSCRTWTPEDRLSEQLPRCPGSPGTPCCLSPFHAPAWTEDFSCCDRLFLLSVRMYGKASSPFPGKRNYCYYLQPGYPCKCNAHAMSAAGIPGS